MVRRLGVFGSAGALFASVLVAMATFGAPAAQADSFQDWATVSAGNLHTCGVRSNGKLYCWGDDTYGEIGDGDDDNSQETAPRRIGTFEDWATVSAGAGHSCGVRTNGKLYCWGSDGNGEVGDGDATAATSPRRIGTFEDWATVSAGGEFSCGVRKNGKLYCWGHDDFGQVGDGDALGTADSPRRIGTFEDWANVSAGSSHTCGVRSNGKLYCWGSDDDDQIGDGSDNNASETAPRRIGTFEDWTTVDAGGAHSCGVRKNGKLYCWGADNTGQVGDGDGPASHTSPVRVGAFEDWVSASTGFFHTCGVRSNGKLYCWGYDADGEVGDGDAADNAIAPHRIGTFEDWAASSAGANHTCGVRSNGKLYCWGSDSAGQVGDGVDDVPDFTPRRI